jgi:hypothetical protein
MIMVLWKFSILEKKSVARLGDDEGASRGRGNREF